MSSSTQNEEIEGTKEKVHSTPHSKRTGFHNNWLYFFIHVPMLSFRVTLRKRLAITTNNMQKEVRYCWQVTAPFALQGNGLFFRR